MQPNSFLINIYLVYKFCFVKGKSHYKLIFKKPINKSIINIEKIPRNQALYINITGLVGINKTYKGLWHIFKNKLEINYFI